MNAVSIGMAFLSVACLAFLVSTGQSVLRAYREHHHLVDRKIGDLRADLDAVESRLEAARRETKRWKYVAQWTVGKGGNLEGAIYWRGTRAVDTLLADYEKKEKSRRAAR